MQGKDLTTKQKLMFVNFSDLEISPYQPDSRMEDDAAYKALKADIEKHGCYTPPTVDKDLFIINGHRRIRAMRELGMEGTTVCVLSQKDEAGGIFKSTNTAKTITPRQETEIYLKGGEVSQRTLLAINHLTKTCGGKAIIKHIAARNANPVSLYKHTAVIKKYLGAKSLPPDIQIVTWLIERATAYRIRWAIETNITKPLLRNLIKKNLPLEKPTQKKMWDMAAKEAGLSKKGK